MLFVFLLTGCAELADGLKEALISGAKSSSSILSAENGYYGDEPVKVLLPEGKR